MSSSLYCLIVITTSSPLYRLGYQSALALFSVKVLCVTCKPNKQFALIFGLREKTTCRPTSFQIWWWWSERKLRIFLPESDRSRWIRSTNPVECMLPSPGQIWFRLIHLGCSDHSVCSALSDHLNLFLFYLINLIVIDWPGWFGHIYQFVHNPIRLLLLLCSFYYLDSGKVVKLLRSR